ncbi:imidazolonepropionase [Clostridium algoriphilum]|uniref:imidazolonepropionase n=1 Tax=Clostridium algoriphilum TaxID=198347 RepID=UPI001CF38093|nr:imidazolonepropionase [Clostridium algoriphilum]MCB2296144.1 imidazolonepropionase [Clostridium algoriphilum]
MKTKGRKQFGEFIINNVLTLIEEGKSYREISEIYQLGDKRVVEQLMNRYRRKQRLLEIGITPCQKGRPRKNHLPTEQDRDMEIKRLKMENELLRSFLQSTGRR